MDVLASLPAWAGCWIFFILSGYLAGISFYNKRYELTLSGIYKYYKKKIGSIYLPTLYFIGICVLLVSPKFFAENPGVILSMLSCMYYGAPGFNGIGATWFVFTLMWLYLFTPIMCGILNRVNSHKRILLIWFCIVCIGFIYREVLYEMKVNWVTGVYTAVLPNIDLYFGGICIAYFCKKKVTPCVDKQNIKKMLFWTVLFSVVAWNSYIWTQKIYIEIYQYYLETVYLVLISIYLILYTNTSHNSTGFFWIPVNWFAGISFEFYLFHSLVLGRIADSVGGHSSLEQYWKLVILTAVFSVLLSVGYNKIFSRKTNH